METASPFAYKKLMTPGPVAVPDYVKDIFANCHIHHRRKEFERVLVKVLDDLKKVFQTDQPCFLLPCTGSGGMEAAIVNVLSPGEKVLVIDGGKFGERWIKMAKAFDLKPEVVTVEWGRDLNIDVVKAKLSEGGYSALLVQACETSTGAAHPIEALGQLCKGTETLLIVDGITALGAYSLPMDTWGIDALIGGSQKAFMLPTGLAFVALSEKAWVKSKTAKIKKYYFNLTAELEANKNSQTRYSTPVQFVVALDRVLNEILVEKGLQNFFDQTQHRAQLFRQAVHLQNFADTPSPSLSCIKVPEGVTAGSVVKQLEADYNIAIVAGQDQIKDKVLRISHMGYMTDKDLLETADAINRIVKV